MKTNFDTPYYVCDELKLENNLKKLKYIQDETKIKILIALKAFALKSVMHLVGKYLSGCCASGLYEAKYGRDTINKEVHTFSCAFKDDEINEIYDISNYIVFNSIGQLMRFEPLSKSHHSIGLRLNPQISFSPVDIYNPCATFSRFGMTKKEFELIVNKNILSKINGFHFHILCEQNSDAFAKILFSIEDQFSNYFKNIQWINFGGGLNLTQGNFDTIHFIKLINDFRNKYSHLTIYIEPGEAVAYNAGTLVATVIDIVHNDIDVVILDTSIECHMPDVLAMPYTPNIIGAKNINISNIDFKKLSHLYRICGNTCLSGDIMGDYVFDDQLNIGDKIVIEDQMHYTMVKNTTFNGVKLPDYGIKRKDGTIDIVKTFGYEDYANKN